MQAQRSNAARKHPQGVEDEGDSSEKDESDPLETSNIRILESSLPVPPVDPSFNDSSGSYYSAASTNRPLLRNRVSPLSEKPNPLTPANLAQHQRERMLSAGTTWSQASAVSGTTAATGVKKSKIRWHFGIRSRSEPLEVMLEIYRTLETLGFEWKEKEPERRIVMEDYGDAYGESLPSVEEARERGLDRDEMKKRKRKEEEEFVKKAQALYLIETRCRLDDVVVRMDLQLYSIDKENYLVDFRNLGYRKIKPPPASHGTASPAFPVKGVSFADDEDPAGSSSLPGTPGGPLSPHGPRGGGNTPEPRSRQPSIDPTAGSSSLAAAAGGSFSARQLWEAAAKTRTFSHSTSAGQRPAVRRSKKSAEMVGGNVSSPFLFLECACRLIVELGESSLLWQVLALAGLKLIHLAPSRRRIRVKNSHHSVCTWKLSSKCFTSLPVLESRPQYLCPCSS